MEGRYSYYPTFESLEQEEQSVHKEMNSIRAVMKEYGGSIMQDSMFTIIGGALTKAVFYPAMKQAASSNDLGSLLIEAPLFGILGITAIALPAYFLYKAAIKYSAEYAKLSENQKLLESILREKTRKPSNLSQRLS